MTCKIVYVTGKIEGMTKKDVEKIVEDKGHVYSSFSKKTELLVYGERAGPNKLETARSLGIEIISWEEFLQKY